MIQKFDIRKGGVNTKPHIRKLLNSGVISKYPLRYNLPAFATLCIATPNA